MGVSHDHCYEDYQCRICFEDSKPSEVISPCKCKGTLRYVHPACLRKWQCNVLKLGNANDERAYTCGVCRSRYTTGPPRPNLWRNACACVRGLTGALCISLLALGLSGPPLLHVALLALLLLGTRSQALACLLLLAALAALGALHARGLRVVLRANGAGRLGVALIRYGAPVEGLRPGSLLVASPGLEDSLFERSVVLVTEAGRRGAKGVMLTQPLGPADDAAAAAAWAAGAGAPGPRVSHFLGGPVSAGPAAAAAARRAPGAAAALAAAAAAAAGRPRDARRGGAAAAAAAVGVGLGGAEIVVLHHVPGLPGSSLLIRPAAPMDAAAAAAAQGPDCEEEEEGEEGGAAPAPAPRPRWVSVVRSKAAAAAAAVVAAASRRRPGAGHRRAGGGGGGGGGAEAGGAARRLQGSAEEQAAAAAGLGLYLGGPLEDVVRALQAPPPAAPAPGSAAAAAAAAAAPRAPGGRGAALLGAPPRGGAGAAGAPTTGAGGRGGTGAAAGPAVAVRVYHGVCAWAAGQLEGELRGGVWGLVPRAAAGDVAATPPAQLWRQLSDSGRARWL